MKGIAYNPRSPDEKAKPRVLNLCHCKSCRHNAGLACVSYMTLGSAPFIDELQAYKFTPHSKPYICATCGCHICWRCEDAKEGSGGVIFATEAHDH